MEDCTLLQLSRSDMNSVLNTTTTFKAPPPPPRAPPALSNPTSPSFPPSKAETPEPDPRWRQDSLAGLQRAMAEIWGQQAELSRVERMAPHLHPNPDPKSDAGCSPADDALGPPRTLRASPPHRPLRRPPAGLRPCYPETFGAHLPPAALPRRLRRLALRALPRPLRARPRRRLPPPHLLAAAADAGQRTADRHAAQLPLRHLGAILPAHARRPHRLWPLPGARPPVTPPPAPHPPPPAALDGPLCATRRVRRDPGARSWRASARRR